MSLTQVWSLMSRRSSLTKRCRRATRQFRKPNLYPRVELLEDRYLLSPWDVHPVTADGEYPVPETDQSFYIKVRESLSATEPTVDVFVRLVRPDVPAGVKVPVILMYWPYSDSNTTTATVGSALSAAPLKNFVSRGYALAVADVPGTGNSGGCWDLLGLREQAAGYDLVEWFGTQEWSNGKVAMAGVSYPGGTAVMTAAARPPHLATIVPEFPLTSVYDVLYHDGVRLDGLSPYNVTGLEFPAIVEPAVHFDFFFGLVPPTNPDATYSNRVFERACADTQDKLIHTQRSYELDPSFDAFWQERDWVKDAAHLAVPAAGTGYEVSVLVTGGWTDELLKPNQPHWFESIPVDNPGTATDEGVPFKMLVMSNRGHGFQNPQLVDENLLHAWFDRFLYGYDTNIENQPPVWSIDNTQDFQHPAASWPFPETEPVNLFLRQDGSLSVKPSRTSEYLGSYTDTGLETESQVFLAHEAPGVSFLWFESGELQQDLRIDGRAYLKLLASTSTTSTHFAPVLFDLGPHGQPLDASEGNDSLNRSEYFFKVWGNQQCELLQEQDVCTLSRGFLNARFKDGLEQVKDLAPGEQYRASVRFIDKDWLIRGRYVDPDGTVHAGHRIGLAVMSSNTDFALPDQQRATNSLFSERGARTVLVLPVVGGNKALKVALGDTTTNIAPELLGDLADAILAQSSSLSTADDLVSALAGLLATSAVLPTSSLSTTAVSPTEPVTEDLLAAIVDEFFATVFESDSRFDFLNWPENLPSSGLLNTV